MKNISLEKLNEVRILKLKDYLDFIEKEWNHLCETYPTQKNLFARYISKMKLASFKNFSYSDSDYFNKNY